MQIKKQTSSKLFRSLLIPLIVVITLIFVFTIKIVRSTFVTLTFAWEVPTHYILDDDCNIWGDPIEEEKLQDLRYVFMFHSAMLQEWVTVDNIEDNFIIIAIPGDSVTEVQVGAKFVDGPALCFSEVLLFTSPPGVPLPAWEEESTTPKVDRHIDKLF